MIDWNIMGARGPQAHCASLFTATALSPNFPSSQSTGGTVACRPWDSNRRESRGQAVSPLGRDPSEGKIESVPRRERPEQGRGGRGPQDGPRWVPIHLAAHPWASPLGLCQLTMEMPPCREDPLRARHLARHRGYSSEQSRQDPWPRGPTAEWEETESKESLQVNVSRR